MKRFTSVTVACLVLMPSAGAEETASKQIAARIELHSIQTLTLSDQQFLKGDPDGKPAVTTGEFRIAQGQGRLPVVVLMHGSGGVGANVDMWVRELNHMGLSTFVIDGFTGRGLTAVSTDQARLGRLNLILDIYRALDILAKHPRVDPQRIALMGFSRGGQAALYASLKRFNEMWNHAGIRFAAYFPFYPDCATTFVADTDLADAPVRIFAGAIDDYNPAALCQSYVERLRAAGRNVEITIYPNAAHAFDNPLGATTPTVAKDAQTVRRCSIREASVGLLVNAKTEEPFTYKDPCVERDPHVGYDPAATAAAKQAVKASLRTVFRLD